MMIYNLPNPDAQALDAVVLANGKFPEHYIAASILKNSEYLVCCDGAVNQLITNTNIIPSAIVGDCDSLNDENRLKFSNILFVDNDQETNDLTKSIKFCISKQFRKVMILGATGKREDHTLANISLLIDYMDIIEVEMVTDYGIFTPIKSKSIFESFEKQQISLFAMEKGEVTVHNLKYPVEKRIFSNWWQGTLNESLGNEFTIDTSSKMIVYRAF